MEISLQDIARAIEEKVYYEEGYKNIGGANIVVSNVRVRKRKSEIVCDVMYLNDLEGIKSKSRNVVFTIGEVMKWIDTTKK